MLALPPMVYPLNNLPLDTLIDPVVRAAVALARLDTRLQASPVSRGWIERSHFTDAAAALWLEGGLVQMEDLVLHDERMDVRAPSHELTRAHAVLRARRRIAASAPGWALSLAGLSELAGPAVPDQDEPDEPQPARQGMTGKARTGQGRAAADPDSEDMADADVSAANRNPEDDPLAVHFAALDAVLERTNQLLDGGVPPPRLEASQTSGQDQELSKLAPYPARGQSRPSLVYDLDWDETARMAEWVGVLEQSRDLPVMLRAAILLDAWGQIEVLQHGGWLGGLLVAALLRQEGLSAHHLPCLHLGSRNIARERRRSPDRTHRLTALLAAMQTAAEIGLKQHDRLVLAKAQMEQRLKNRRSSSRLPELIALVLSRPLVSSPMIEKTLKVTQQGALNLIDELDLRELTGRKRFRAWGVV